MRGERETVRFTIRVAARRAGISPRTVRRYVRRGLVGQPLTEDDLVVLRRIRRLTDLGINLAGVEAILRMRERIEALEAHFRSWARLPEMPDAWMLLSPDEWDERD